MGKRNKGNKKAIRLIMLMGILALSFLFSCDSTTNPPDKGNIEVIAEDVSCTEVWLNLKTENISLPTKIEITQNDSTVMTTNINSNDTTLYIDNLLPSKTYNFQTIIQSANKKSNSISVTTMDTTSHNFTWETFTFGGVNGSSYFNDVAVINENDIWAVGLIHTAETDQFDSNGVWVQPYNAVHWNGQKWELKRILVNYRGNLIFLSLESIFAFSGTDIWLVSSLPIHGDGENWQIYDVRKETNSDLSLTNVWGSSSNDIYFVGRSGSLAHYNGTNWTKIESGTEENLYDVYGIDNLVYAVGGSNMSFTGVLLKGDINGFKVEREATASYVDSIFNPYFVGGLSTVWLTTNATLYFGGGALYKHKYSLWDFDRSLEGNCLRCNGGGEYYASVSKIRGNRINDIVFVGARNTIRHFNGVSWQQLGVAYNPSDQSILYYSVAVDNNIIIAVGSNNGEAFINKFIR